MSDQYFSDSESREGADGKSKEDELQSPAFRQDTAATSLSAISPIPRRLLSPTALKWLVALIRFGLAALFLFTAGAKIAIAKPFATNVSELLSASGFNSVRWTWPATIAVITAEVIAAVLLLLPRTVRAGALGAATLLIGFAAYALYYVYALHGEPLECGCFGGIIASQLGVSTALRNLTLLIPALIVFFGYSPPPRAASSEPITTPAKA